MAVGKGSKSKLEDLFPLDNLDKVMNVFREELKKGNNADLAMLSVLAGYVEDYFTTSRVINNATTDSSENKSTKTLSARKNNKEVKCNALEDIRLTPALTKKQIDAMHQKFSSMIRGYCDLSLITDLPPGGHMANRQVIQRVSDIIWNTLNEDKNKDRSHASNVFCYLTEAKVNCFGLALAVVAGCQVLGFHDVHLAMSEDHAWVVYGHKGEQTAEVTWHERVPADRRGEPLDQEHCARSWLYSGGHPVVCNRQMEVAAIVTAINPNLSSQSTSYEVLEFQRCLLWLLHEGGHLARYPMALGTLAEIQEYSEFKTKISSEQLYLKGISTAERNYSGRHIYPYLYLASYYYRSANYTKAIAQWAAASQVLRHFNYSKEDDEIYKEFYEINTELIPGLLKQNDDCAKDPACFASLVRFCDGLCSWEELGSTPVLHVGWTKSIIKFITMFDHSIRIKVKFVPANINEGTPRRKAHDGSIELYSWKMTGLISLLESEKMNAGALQLQLTAQAQIDSSRRKSEVQDPSGSAPRVKRLKKV